MGLLSSLFKGKSKVSISELIQQGATVVDVRTKNEFKLGHVKGSVNIPLDQLDSGASKLKKENPIITCCASGMRSAAAKNLLRKKGFEVVENGGSWQNVNRFFK